jgi:hypothetical protein
VDFRGLAMIGRCSRGILGSCLRCAFPFEHLLVRGGDFLRPEEFVQEYGLPAVGNFGRDPDRIPWRRPQHRVELVALLPCLPEFGGAARWWKLRPESKSPAPRACSGARTAFPAASDPLRPLAYRASF